MEAGPARTTSLSSTYFDAPDLRLHKAGVALRIREIDGGRRLQTVKTRGDGLFARGEWESAVERREPDLNSLKGTPAAGLFSADEPFDALFTVAVERTVRQVTRGRSRIEIAIDRGRIFKSADPVSAIAVGEVELELLAGAPQDLFALAADIMAAAPLRLGVASKSARGHALLEGRLNDVANAQPVPFGDEPSAADAFRAIANACLVQLRMNEDVMLARRDSDALHQTRVAIRRLRSAFSLFGPLLRHARTDELKAELKRLSEPLGPARDLDVFLAETLADERERRPDESGLLNLEKQLQTQKAKAYDGALATLRSDEWRRLVVELAGWINVGAWLRSRDEQIARQIAGPARDFAATVLEKRYRQVRRKSRRITKITDEKRHDARISAKKLRYGSEFFADLFADKPKRERKRVVFVKAVKRLQGRLGALNDVATGHELMADAAQTGRSRSAAFAAGVTAADGDARADALLKEAKETRKALMAAEPFWR
ncbi:CHAD domain-containing protein [Chenggangzhangella methanolivorans]|nr:CHAD domain-containing protein [Chenggangzhangella methanolivorans]